MTTMVRIGKVDSHKVAVVVKTQVRTADGEWVDEPQADELVVQGAHIEKYVYTNRRVVVEEVTSS